jgi:hypothetical protein
VCRRDRIAHCQDQPVGSGVQDQAHLIGQRASLRDRALLPPSRGSPSPFALRSLPELS